MILAIFFGLCLGCSAPGIGLWLTSWFCLAPLLFLINIDRSFSRSFLYAFLFGLAYNCVYLQWYLGLFPLDWLGFNAWQGHLLAAAALLINASHQASLIAVFALLYCFFLRLSSYLDYLFDRINNRFLSRFFPQSSPVTKALASLVSLISPLLHLLFVPLLWILITNKIGNAHDLTGVPWSMLEYTQYKQLPIIQIADVIGGIGLCYLIVMVNTLIAQIASDIFAQRQQYLSVLTPIGISVARNLLSIAVCSFFLVAVLFYGYYNLSNAGNSITALPPSTRGILNMQSQASSSRDAHNPDSPISESSYQNSGSLLMSNQPPEPVSIVQPNINIDMERTKKRYTLTELLAHQFKLSSQCPPGLCVWTESALPASLCDQPETQALLQNFAQTHRLSIILGTIDRDAAGNSYNAAWAVSANGAISNQIYHKQYLVPFGEYTPAFVRNWPQWILNLTNTPAGTGYACGTDPALINIDNKLIAPLICFEIISPELAAASVRAGGQLLVNINDLAWFHKSIIGEQMIACAVFRAVENRRDLIFAANTGPSAVISASGKIKCAIGQNQAADLINNFNYSSKLSLFTRFFVF